MNTMTHRGYAAQIDYSEDDGCFVGHIADIEDIVGFHGESVAELRDAFEEAVDDYLQTCKRLNRSPQEPYIGKLLVGVAPEKRAGSRVGEEVNSKRAYKWSADAEIPMPGLLRNP